MSSVVGFSNEGFDDAKSPTTRSPRGVPYSANNHAPRIQRGGGNVTTCILVVMGILIVGLIAAIVIVAVLFSPLMEDNKNNKNMITQLNHTMEQMKRDMQKVNQSWRVKIEGTEKIVNDLENELNLKYRQLEATQRSSSLALQVFQNSTNADVKALKDFDIVINQNISGFRTVYKYSYVGLAYGRNSQSVVADDCHGTMDRLQCLLFCYEEKKTQPAITGLNIRRVDDRCCCELNADVSNEKSDKGFLHYVLERH